MKKAGITVIIITLLLLAITGYAQSPAAKDVLNTVYAKTVKQKGETIAAVDLNEGVGANSYQNSGDNPNSRYYVNPDFFRIKSDENLTLIEGFKTMQQTTEWSCGNVAALMVLYHFGITDETELRLAEAMGTHTDRSTPGAKPGSAVNPNDYGTNVEQLYHYFSSAKGLKVVETSYRPNGRPDDILTADDGVCENDTGNYPPTFASASLYASENSDDTELWVKDAKDSFFVQWLLSNLKGNRPIMVEWGDWDGHWQVIIGYDNNGTPGVGDDILIFADPYDTSDHWQDGYYYYPLERWFNMWQDRAIAPKPYQLQPYIIIDRS